MSLCATSTRICLDLILPNQNPRVPTCQHVHVSPRYRIPSRHQVHFIGCCLLRELWFGFLPEFAAVYAAEVWAVYFGQLCGNLSWAKQTVVFGDSHRTAKVKTAPLDFSRSASSGCFTVCPWHWGFANIGSFSKPAASAKTIRRQSRCDDVRFWYGSKCWYLHGPTRNY